MTRSDKKQKENEKYNKPMGTNRVSPLALTGLRTSLESYFFSERVERNFGKGSLHRSNHRELPALIVESI